jgi:hypothetical protein
VTMQNWFVFCVKFLLLFSTDVIRGVRRGAVVRWRNGAATLEKTTKRRRTISYVPSACNRFLRSDCEEKWNHEKLVG